MKSSYARAISLLSLLAFALSPQTVPAQEDVLEEIIVTGRKIEENIFDAPITVNVFTAENLEDAGVTQTADYIQMIPNVTLAESQTIGTSFLTVRGLSRVRNGELPVAVVVDDVLIVNARQYIGQVFDTRQIEVVKGPQGALYGRNASNGAIIVQTNPPATEGPEGYIKTSYGTEDEVGLEAVWSGPLNDTVAVRLSGRMLERDGYFTNVTLQDEVDPYRDRTLRGRLSWAPSETLLIDLKASVSKHEGKGIGFHWPGLAIFGVDLSGELGYTQDEIVREGANLVDIPYVANNPDRGFRDTTGFSLKIDKTFDGFDFKSVTTYDELEASSVADRAPYLSVLDGTQHSYVDVDGWSQELRLSSNTAGRLRWQVGAYYLNWERLRTTVTGEDLGLGIKRATTVPEFEDSTNPTGLAPGNFLSFTEDSSAWAVFGSVDFDLTERFILSLAGRYDEETREQTPNLYNTAGRVYSQAGAAGVNNPYSATACGIRQVDDPNSDGMIDDPGGALAEGQMPDINCGAYDTFALLLENTQTRDKIEKDFSKFQPKVTLAYQVSDQINLYGSWGIGYRAGQFNYPGVGSISATANDVIDQEENETWEIGVKGDYGNFRFNAAYFNSTVDNTQYFPFDGAAFVQVFEDVDESELDGFELEGAWRIGAFDLYAAYGKTNSEITGYAERSGTEGNDLPYVPEYTFNTGARYERSISDGLSFFGRLDYERRGQQYWTPENSYPRDDLTLMNARIGLQGDSWTTSVYVNNLTDEEYNSEVVTPLFLHPAPPRTWRWDFRYDF